MPPSPSTPHPAVKTPLRFCLSCCATLVCWTIWLALGASLAALTYVALVRDLPVPGFVLRRIESRLADADLALRFDRVRFDPQGRLLLEGAALRSTRFEEPLLLARMLYLEGSIWAALVGHATPDEVRIEGGVLQLPAMLSPSGTAQPLVQDLAATLRRVDRRWRVDQLVFRTGPLAVTVTGEFAAPRQLAPARALAAHVASYLRLARPLAGHLEQLARCEEPSLAIRLDSRPGVGNTAALLFTAREIRGPSALGQPVKLEQIAATTVLRLERGAVRPLRVHAAAGRVTGREFAARSVRAVIQANAALVPFSLVPGEAWISAAQVEAQTETAHAPMLHALVSAWPSVWIETTFLAGAGPIAAEVEAQLRERSARVRLAGRADPEFFNGFLARRAPRAAPWLVLGEPLSAEADAVFAPGWQLAGLTAQVQAGRLDARGVGITSIEGRIDFDGRELYARDAVLRAGENIARGSYWMDVGSRDFRILLGGALRPQDINSWFRRPWWGVFWRDFEFPAGAPRADVDLAGRWGDPSRARNFIAADAASPRVRGADFERVRTRLFVRPHFIDGVHLHAVRGGGRETLRGNYSRNADPAGRIPVRLGFDLASTVDPQVLDLLLQGAARPVLDDWQFNRPPHLRFTGTWTFQPEGGRGDLTFSGDARGGVRYQGFPLDTVRATGRLNGPELRLDEFEFTVANGRGRGHASLGGPPGERRLGFDVYVQDADLGPAVQAVQAYQAARDGTPPNTAAPSRFLQRAAAAKLQLALSAAGRPGALETFQGSGNARLTGATLSEIHLFGLLSQVLSGLTFNFSTLKLDTVHGSFELAGGRVHFPELKVTGDSAIIDAQGEYTFADNGLNFTARFRPYGENRNLLTGALGLVLNPLTSAVELKLSGPLSQPQWSYSLGSSPTEDRPAAPPEAGAPPAPSPQP